MIENYEFFSDKDVEIPYQTNTRVIDLNRTTIVVNSAEPFKEEFWMKISTKQGHPLIVPIKVEIFAVSKFKVPVGPTLKEPPKSKSIMLTDQSTTLNFNFAISELKTSGAADN